MHALQVAVLAAALAALPATAAGAPDPAKGRETFQAQCAVCHNADNDQKKMGPGLKGLFKRAKLASGKKVSDATVRARIDEGGNGMPAYKDMLNDQEKDDIIAYLRTL
jgi:mono/diheme cytochrome c family protein